MKKITLLFASLLCVAYIAVAQLKLYVYQNGGTRTEFVASTVDSIAFSTIANPDQPDDPVKPVGPTNGYEYVDLGLPSGLLWATMNVGADSPEDYGDYFAWGETQPKNVYDRSTYKWYNGNSGEQTKYCTDSYWGTVDNKTILELSDDAANASWGGDWRMPTYEEQDELRKECTWTWITKNGVNGYTVTGPNGNSIFLPAAGYRSNSGLSNAGSYGGYWGSSLYTDASSYACFLGFLSSNVYSNVDSRYYGQSVRPVLRIEFTYNVIFDSNGGEGTMPTIAIDQAELLSIPENKFTRPGYEFIGWNTKADGTGTSYADGQSISIIANTTLYAQWKDKISGTANGHDYVDLGLPSGTLWATCNVGAEAPEEYGDYFAWGETEPKEEYNWSAYKWCNGRSNTITKYCVKSECGTVDNKTVLDLSDDVANATWGRNWRMPTKAEQDELRNTSYTTWTWTTQNGANGYKVTSKSNGNSIFLPAGESYISDLNSANSYGYYWSRSLYLDYSSGAYSLRFYSDDVNWYYGSRNYGFSVRPVIFTFTLMFDGNGGEGSMPAIDGQHKDRVIIPASTFKREGYYVAGWNTKADGTGISYTEGETISITANTTLYAQWKLSSGTSSGSTWIDLGLPSGTKWATMNVGATSPEDYGDYFAWGETQPKETYNWSTYKWCEGRKSTQTKYCTDYDYGTLDYNTILDLEDDVANANLGGDWCMPTQKEQEELRTECTWTWNAQNGVNGYTVTGPSGNSIFLPAAGYRDNSGFNGAGSGGYYWSSSLNTSNSSNAYYLRFDSSNVGISYFSSLSDGNRYYGYYVRPVLRDVEFTFTLMFDINGGEGSIPAIEGQYDDIVIIPASTFVREGYYFDGWNTKADGTGTSYIGGEKILITANTTLYAQWKENIISGTANGHDYVDLGLPSGTLWATCNVGAEIPEDYGYYFAWGETQPKYNYDWEYYKWCNGSSTTLTKYCTDSDYGIVDNKTTLDRSDDAANAKWGGDWRMPTKAEQDELRNFCSWTWITRNGVKGYKVTSVKNGNSIFLPAAGYRSSSAFYYAGSYGYYWSSSLITNDSNDAYYLSFDSSDVDSDGYSGNISDHGRRNDGHSVRPVLAK